mmetsp:Transcript_6590/g.10025  ORF Transcript_6590/g.10025 Transcript_6590/m.10025 type:complete len:89 (-) Transcript_6590:3-269(-)
MIFCEDDGAVVEGGDFSGVVEDEEDEEKVVTPLTPPLLPSFVMGIDDAVAVPPLGVMVMVVSLQKRTKPGTDNNNTMMCYLYTVLVRV